MHPDLLPSVGSKVLLRNQMISPATRPADPARLMNVQPQEVNRLATLRHPTKIDTIARAFMALGKRLELSVAQGARQSILSARSCNAFLPTQEYMNSMWAINAGFGHQLTVATGSFLASRLFDHHGDRHPGGGLAAGVREPSWHQFAWLWARPW